MIGKLLILICAVLCAALFSAAVSGLDVAGLARRGSSIFGAARTVAPFGATEPTEGFSLPFRIGSLSMREPDVRLLMPVGGVRVRQVADTWGAARSGGRAHSGQDIFAKRGTPIYSATEGYVLRVGESPVGGKNVFVIGAGGRHYYYAHLHEHAEGLAEGDYVTTDSLLGYVGATGNAKGTPPHLHFGVYTEVGAINPLPLLADRA